MKKIKEREGKRDKKLANKQKKRKEREKNKKKKRRNCPLFHWNNMTKNINSQFQILRVFWGAHSKTNRATIKTTLCGKLTNY